MFVHLVGNYFYLKVNEPVQDKGVEGVDEHVAKIIDKLGRKGHLCS